VLFAIAVKIDFGGETAPRAGHQWLLYARRSSPFDSMKVLCLNCDDLIRWPVSVRVGNV